MSSKTAGVFTILLESTLLGVSTRIASEDVRMEDLLQARYERRAFLSLFNGKAKFNFERFLYQINKKYVSNKTLRIFIFLTSCQVPQPLTIFNDPFHALHDLFTC
jgi:Ras GTPase-activating-like protein IQGAP2/3